MNRGVALVQVLIISLILSVLSLFIIQSTQSQIKTTSMIQERFKLRLMLENAEASLLEALIRNRRYKSTNSKNQIVDNWNFYGQEFFIGDNVSVLLQDERSLVNLNITNRNLFLQTLKELGLTQEESVTLYESLEDWKDNDSLSKPSGQENYNLYQPRNNELQSFNELFHIKGSEKLAEMDVEHIFTITDQIGFNPLNAPEPVLKAFLNNDYIAQRVIELREQKQISEGEMYELSGIETSEYINFATGNQIRVQLSVAKGDIRLRKSFNLSINPASKIRPIVISGIKWN